MSSLATVIRRDTVPQGLGAKLLPFWWQHTESALAAFVLLAALFASTRLDLDIAHALFFDSVQRHWIGADSWWTNELIHTGGQWLMRCLAAASVVLWSATFFKPGWRTLRRPSAYFSIATVLSVGIVGLLKTITNVHCPWALADFGGELPYLHLFAHRPELMRPGHCFPAAHASTGYALIALYFVFRDRSVRLARAGLAAGILAGAIFGLAQQSRGAHFVSHDVWSAFLVWMISLTLYTFAFRARLWPAGPAAR